MIAVSSPSELAAADGVAEGLIARSQGAQHLSARPRCLDDWERDEGATIHIECVDRRAEDTVFLTEAQVAERLGKIARQTRYSVDWYQDVSRQTLEWAGAPNRFWLPPFRVTSNGGNPRAVYIKGIYELAEDEALIIECALPECKYWSLQLAALGSRRPTIASTRAR